jgi:hypothetical protein
MKISYEILVSNCLYIVNRARVSHSCDQFGLRLNTETGLLRKFPGLKDGVDFSDLGKERKVPILLA